MAYKEVFNLLFDSDKVTSQVNFQQQFNSNIHQYSSQDVQRALSSPQGNLDALKVLLSPAAEHYIEPMAQLSASLTRQRFGANINLFVPLYLSNLCANECDYCGFTMSNKVKRKVLNHNEIEQEIAVLKHKGFDSVLLVTGEHQTKVGIEYFERVVPKISSHFSYLAMEVQPLTQNEYVKLGHLGLNAVMIYQESYCQQTYAKHHTRGNKQDFYYRLQTPERIANAGIAKIGLGILLGLADWRVDAWMLGHHLTYLQKHHWRSRYSISVPRLRPCTGGIKPKYPITDKQLLQMICAFRLFSPDLEISLSTRESVNFRNGMFPLGITHISAESVTEPGGYASPHSRLAQFEISDERKVAEIVTMLKQQQLQPVIKDWERQWNSTSRII